MEFKLVGKDHSRRWGNLALAVFIAVFSLLLSMTTCPAAVTSPRDAAFKGFTSELDRIERGEHARAAMVEMNIARQMVKNGRLLFREGRLRKSAIIAERLPVQIKLIRALIVAERALHDAARMEREVRAMKRSLNLLRARYQKILSKIHPVEATEIFAAKKGEKQ